MRRTALAAALLALGAAGCSSALHSAALRGRTDVVRAELDRGADVNGRYGLVKFTPLMAAASSGDPETVKLLLERGADVRATSAGGKTALDWVNSADARRVGTAAEKEQVVAMLVAAGARSRSGSATAPVSLFGKRAEPSAPVPAPAAAPSTPVMVSDVDRPLRPKAERPDDFALVVGIEAYQSLPKADYGVRDAETVRRHLAALGVPERNIISLTGSAATGGKLKSYLREWLPRNVKPDSTVFVYYSGHGAPDPTSGDAYLVPWDGDPMFLESTALPLKEFYGDLAKLKAKRVLVALDACFSGAGGRSVLAKGARPLVVKVAEAVPASGRLTVLAAASGSEITGSLDEQGHGIFTYYFLKGLSGAAAGPSGAVTPKSLFDYLKPRVQDEARRQNREQTPTLAGGRDEAF